MEKQLPTYMQNLTKEALEDTLAQLDASTQDLVAAGKVREGFYEEKAELMRSKRTMETALELKVSEAYMNIQGESRSQFVIVEGHKLALTNEETRKAYAAMHSKEERKQLAEVESKIAALDVERFRATEDWERVREAARSVQVKATLQASILDYLAN